MARWSYHTEILTNGSAEEIQGQIARLFENLGANGWELVSIVTGDQYSERVVAVFKMEY